MHDTTLLGRQQSLAHGRNTPLQKRQAARMVHKAALGPADETELLRMLGLPQPLGLRQKRLRAAARERGRLHPELIPHGTVSAYDYWQCRCLTCINGNSARCKARREARLAAVPDLTLEEKK
ncbi:MAG TPA: hypothetical protein VL738_01670 [Dactylosporangium sp.]|nr:hypothetical protein [Dactylosporangium sp.]